MKKRYVVYAVTGNKVLLFLNQSGRLSGYVLEEMVPEIHKIGSIFIYEGSDTKVASEEMIFSLTDKKLSGVEPMNILLRLPVWYEMHQVPLDEMTKIQKAVLPVVLRLEAFSGFIRYEDKRRKNIINKDPPV